MRGISWDDSKPKPRRSIMSALVLLALFVAGATPASALAPSDPDEAVIVQRTPGTPPGLAERAVEAAHGHVGRQLGIIDSFAARIPADAIARLESAPGIESIVPDGRVQMHASDFSATADFGSVYNAQLRSGVMDLHKAGLNGAGVTVALIDTGIVPVNGLRTPGKVIYGPDLSFESQAANLRNLDTYGHGTHMAGIIAGRDDAAVAPYTDSNHFTGVAPEARILSIKIGDARGATDVSTMIAAIDWVVAHRNDNGMNVRVMNLSFGTDSTQYYAQDPIAHAVENAWAKGIVVVAAAGNSGNGTGGLDNPARDPHIIAVGSVSYSADVANGKKLEVLDKCLGTPNEATADFTPVVLADCGPWGTRSTWNVKADGSVVHVQSGRCLDVANERMDNGAKIILYGCHGRANQRWAGSFAKTSELKSAASGRCLDVPGRQNTLGLQMQIYDCNLTPAQRFIFPLADDAVSTFSQGGDGARNPDVLAPGQSIAGLRAPGSFVDRTFTSAAAGTRFFRGSGTSQSAAFVSGLVALQLQRRPGASTDDIKHELRRLAVPLNGVEPRIQGAGTLDVASLSSMPIVNVGAQPFARSMGYGNGNALQASRGSMKLSMNNIVLAGEKDIFGKPFSAQAMAAARTTGSSWSGGTWNGSSWSGSSWSGSSWSGSSWSGSSWSGSLWSSQSFSSNYWTGSSWSGSSWSGSMWSGSSWSGSTWSSNTLWDC